MSVHSTIEDGGVFAFLAFEDDVKQIAVVGAGRVGLVSAACLAYLGNRVTCVERSPFYLEILRSGRVPFFEPQLQSLVTTTTAAGMLTFASSISEGISGAEIVFLAVGTPQGPDGAVDLTDVLGAAEEIGSSLETGALIVGKSTVPPGTMDRLHAITSSFLRTGSQVTVASNPEFLREGSAVDDFLHPDRIVIGVHRSSDADALRELYAPLDARVFLTDIPTAEMIKSVSNFYLALRISFANQIADLCDALHIDVMDVLAAVGMDARIGQAYLQPGLGFGGPCLPKDLQGLADSAGRFGVDVPLIAAALRVNEQRIEKGLGILSIALDGLRERCICVLGLSFKAGTDDIRDSQSLRFVAALQRAGATVKAHDPLALENFRRSSFSKGVVCCHRIDDAVRGSDAVAVMGCWPQYRELSLTVIRNVMRGNVLFDAANVFKPADVAAAGLRYGAIGRSGARVDARPATGVAHASA